MSGPEVAFRVGQAVLHSWDHVPGAFRPPRAARRASPADLGPGLLAGRAPERVRAMPGEMLVQLAGYAAEISAGQIPVLGRCADVGFPPRWHADPFTGREWPRVAAKRVDYRGGGAKYVWELSRHEFLPVLAAQYAASGDERWAERCVGALCDWVSENPPLVGIHWTSGLEMGIRLVHWSLVWDLTRGSSSWTPRRVHVFAESVALQSRYLRRHPAAFSSANNHLLGELAGLSAFGMSAPNLVGGAETVKRALARFWASLLLQTTGDGVTREQAFHYQAFVLQMAAWLWAGLAARGGALPQAARERLLGLAAFLAEVRDPGGEIIPIGDADDGGVGYLSRERSPGSVPAWIGVLAGEANLLHDPPRPIETWLLREASAESEPLGWAPRSSAAGTEVRVARGRWWRDAGYAAYEWTSGARVLLLMDAGSLGYLSIAAHGHADALSVWLRHGDTWVLTESGTYLYHEDQRWRAYFRGTAAHNTLVIDGADQSVQRGPTLWGARARAEFRTVRFGAAGAVLLGEHDGYLRLHPPALHRRAVIVLPESGVLVVDWVRSSGRPSVAQHWHMGRGEVSEHDGAAAWQGGGVSWSCRSSAGPAVVTRARPEEPFAWRSRHYGVREPGTVISFYAQLGASDGPLVTWWWPGGGARWRHVRLVDDDVVIEGMEQTLRIPDVRQREAFEQPVYTDRATAAGTRRWIVV